MNKSVRKAVWNAPLLPVEKLALFALLEDADPVDLIVEITVAELAKRLGTSERTTTRFLSSLKKKNYLLLMRPPRRHTAPIYKVALGLLEETFQVGQARDDKQGMTNGVKLPKEKIPYSVTHIGFDDVLKN